MDQSMTYLNALMGHNNIDFHRHMHIRLSISHRPHVPNVLLSTERLYSATIILLNVISRIQMNSTPLIFNDLATFCIDNNVNLHFHVLLFSFVCLISKFTLFKVAIKTGNPISYIEPKVKEVFNIIYN